MMLRMLFSQWGGLYIVIENERYVKGDIKMRRKSFLAITLASILAMTGCIGGDAIIGDKGNNDNQNANIVVVDDGKEDPETPDNQTPDTDVEDVTWKDIYDDYLKNGVTELIGDYDTNWRDEWSFGFIYLNDDDIPELVVSSGYEAAGNIILTIINGEVKYMNTARLAFYYEEKGNLLVNSEGHMGYYYDYVYSISDTGFKLECEGEYEDEYGPDGPTGVTKYSIDQEEVNKSEYYSKIDSYIPGEKRISWNKGCSYKAMIDYLEGNGPKDYKEAYKSIINRRASEEGIMFSLVEVTGRDPLLLVVDDNKSSLCAYEDGLVFEGPEGYFSDGQIILMYPSIGVLMNSTSYSDQDFYTTFYEINDGSLVAQYAYEAVETDAKYEPVLGQDGKPVMEYKINGMKVSYEEYSKFIVKNDGIFFEEVVSANSRVTYMEYLTPSEMLDKLK